jgi:hypothetical protein
MDLIAIASLGLLFPFHNGKDDSMRFLKSIVCVIALNSTLVFAASESCTERWNELIEAYKDDSIPFSQRVSAALTDVDLYDNDGCLVEDDASKNRFISQLRTERYVQPIELAALHLTETYTPSGKFAHTTSECILLEYLKDSSSLSRSLNVYTTKTLFQDLTQADVDAYLSRINSAVDQFHNFLANIRSHRESACLTKATSFINEQVAAAGGTTFTPSETDSVEFTDTTSKESFEKALKELKEKAAEKATASSNEAADTSVLGVLTGIDAKIAELRKLLKGTTLTRLAIAKLKTSTIPTTFGGDYDSDVVDFSSRLIKDEIAGNITLLQTQRDRLVSSFPNVSL